MKLKFLFVSCLFLASAISNAAGVCGPVICVGKVKTIFPHGDNGKIYLKSESDMTPLNCTLDQGEFIVLKETNKRHKEIFSMLLSAQMAQKEVTMRVREGSADCELIYTQTNL